MKLFVIAALLSSAPAVADVPPEVPASRTYQIFAPFFFSPDFGDDGEGVFASQGPACLAYSKANDFRQFVTPQSGVTAQAGLRQFVTDLQTQAGLQFISSHGNVGVLGVEAFTSNADATTALANYSTPTNTQPWALGPNDAQVLITPDGYFVIAVTTGYIGRILHTTTHSIVFADACDGFTLSSGFSGAATRGYLGYQGACFASGAQQGNVSHDVDVVFNTMSGIEPVNSSYQNFALATAYQAAADSILKFQPNTQSANGIRLYDAPRIVFAQVTQDVAGNGSFSNTLYNYPSGQQFAGTYPYGAGTANYPGSPGTSSVARTGPILINLRFSEPMNTSLAAFGVQLQFADGTTQDVSSSGQFRTNALPNDSWSATINLRSNHPVGKVIVAVRAQKVFCNPGLDTSNQDLDTVGTGSSVAGSQDISINFTIGNLVVKAYQDAVNYASNGGIGSQVGDTDPLNGITDGYAMIIDASELSSNGPSGVNISGLSIYQGDPAAGGALIGSNTQTFGTDKKYSSADAGLSILSQLPAGTVTVVAYDVLGGTMTLTLTVDPGSLEVHDPIHQAIPDHGGTQATAVSVDVPAGTAQVTIDGPTPFDPVTFLPGESVTYFADYADLDEGMYSISALNSDGVMISSISFVVDRTPPISDAFAGDDNISPINDLTTNNKTVTVRANDPAPGSGMLKFSIVPDQYEDVIVGSTATFGEAEDKAAEYADLPDGQYTVTAWDKVGNTTPVTFTVDATTPSVAVANYEGAGISRDETISSPDIIVNVSDAGSGLAEIGILNAAGGLALTPIPFQNGPHSASVKFSDLRDGDYYVYAKDRAGNQTQVGSSPSDFPFHIHHAPQITLTFDATREFDYEFTYFGFSDSELSVPYSTMSAVFSDESGIAHFVLQNEGGTVVERTYTSPVTMDRIDEVLPVGDYTFSAQSAPTPGNPAGLITNGKFTIYSTSLTPVLTRPSATVSLSGRSLDYKFPVNCLNTGGGFKDIRVQAISIVDGVGALGPVKGPVSCDTGFDGVLEDGLYAIIGVDLHDYETESLFKAGSIHVAVTGYKTGIVNSVNITGSRDDMGLTQNADGDFASAGYADSAPVDLFEASSDLAIPPNAIGAALLAVPSNRVSGVRTSEDNGDAGSPGEDTGMSQTFEVSSDGGEFERIVKWEAFIAEPDCQSDEIGNLICSDVFDWHPLHPTDGLMLGSRITMRTGFTNNSEVFAGAEAGKATPVGQGPTLDVTYLTATTSVDDLPVGSYETPGGQFKMDSSRSVKVANADATLPAILALIAELNSRGQRRASGEIISVDPPTTVFNVPAVASMHFDPAAIIAAGGLPSSVALYQAEPSGNFFRVPGQTLSLAGNFISAPITRLSVGSLFGIFMPTSGDVKPPRTSLHVSAPTASSGTFVFASTTSAISFSAVDDKLAFNDGQGGGAAQTFYSVDGGTYGLVTSTFSLSGDRIHLLAFYSIDHDGNVETRKLQNLGVDATPPSSVLVSTRGLFAITAADPQISGVTSGVGEIRYLIDQPDPGVCGTDVYPQEPRGTCLNPVYGGAFALTNGPHTLAYRAIDRVGNAERWHVVQVVAVPQSEAGGLGIGHDAFDSFWSVQQVSNAFGFAHADSAGVLLASSTLDDGVKGLPWAVFFDTASRAYAIGGAAGPGTQGVDLAVYKASPNGDAIESRTLFDSGYANNDVVFDAKAPGWIVGAAQTDGSAQEFNGDFSLALWRFDPAAGAVQLKATYARAGFDVGTGLATDSDGSLWIAGYSLSPDVRASGGFDLALWHYAADGQTLLGGPFLRPAYLNGIQGGLTARVFVSSASVYVAAARVNASGASDMAFLKFDKSSGQLTAESAWRSADGDPAYPVAILPEASDILVVGGIGSDFTDAALWRFGYDGSFQTATTADAGGAKGAVFRNSELWLAVDGSTVPYHVQAEAAAAGGLIDLRAPRTSLSADEPSYPGEATTYVTNATPLGFNVLDDRVVPGDGLGDGGGQTFYAADGGAFVPFTSSFTLVAEGTHTVSFYSIDADGNAEAPQTQSVSVDVTGPVVTLVSSGTVFSINAVDPVSGGVASGIGEVQYLLDHDPNCQGHHVDTAAPHGTCENLFYAGPFALAPGTHTILFAAVDNVLNGDGIVYSSSVVVLAGDSSAVPTVLTPSTGPIGVPFTITGAGFGIYRGGATLVKFGTTVAPLSVWNDALISGSVPGLSTGAYAVTIERQNASSVTVTGAGTFTVTALSSAALSVSAGPIGAPFTFTGAGFGPYAGALTRVLVDGATAPLSLWNDSTISGTIPGVTPGNKTLVIERATGDGGLSVSAGFAFQVTAPSVTAVSPSSGPIGAAFALAGQSFGPYAGSLTQVLIGGATTALSLWNDAAIAGAVPGALAPGVYPVVVQRRTSDGGLSVSNTVYFEVLGLGLSALSPASGPIGVPFTISGTGFGAYAGGNTRVKFGGAVAALSLWNDATISGTVPALDTGAWTVSVERQEGAAVSASMVATFTVTALSVSAISPSSGPIGTAFTLTGPGFGPYAGASTVVLVDGTTAALSVWNDATITGTVPGGIPNGTKAVVVRRTSGEGIESSASVPFELTGMTLASLSPASGPIGAPFTITGTQFGTYGGANTRVKFGGASAALSLWNDTTITGTVPNLSTGSVTVVVERQQGSDVALSNLSSFTIVGLSPTGVSPSSGPIGTAFTITGSGFGPYAGANTRALVDGVAAALSTWNDGTVAGTIPGTLAPGVHPIWLERSADGGVQSSATGYFTITSLSPASLTPSSAPIGAPFTITGTSFGAYAGALTRVKIGGVLAPLSVWNDTTISGTVPGALSPGVFDIVIERAADGGLASSATQTFTVLVPWISTVSPSFGPTGTVVTLTGAGFGPYGGVTTKVLVGGATVPLSVWNDNTINWTVPAYFADGQYPVVVVREPAGGSVQSASATYTVGSGYGGSSFGLASIQTLASQPDSHFQGDMSFSSATGGRIDTPAKAAVEVPPNAMDGDKEITLKRAHSDGLRVQAADEIKKRAAGEPIEFGPEGTHFATPVTIELPYDPALTGDEASLAIHYFNPLRRAWEELPTEVDRVRHVLKAKTDHFSIYQPMGLAPTSIAQDEFYYRDSYVFPNPSRGGALITFRIQPGLAETVELRVYDLAGRKLHDSSDFTFLGAIDDGNGKGAQDTYDHVWSVGGVGSGVYTYVIKASRGGQKPIIKSGKVGVIR
jgi:hypothetical protein